MRRPNIGRMRLHRHLAAIRQWRGDLEAAGALPWVAREIVFDVYGQCRTWDEMERAMPQVIASAREGGVRNGGPGSPRTKATP